MDRGWRMAAVLGGLLASQVAWAACDAEAVAQGVAEGKRAWIRADFTGVSAAQDATQLEVRCLREVLTPEQAAAVHRLEALAWFGEREMARVEEAFAAARASEPEAGFDAELAVESHPLARAFARAGRQEPDVPAELSLPEGVRAVVDGSFTSSRPVDRPYLLQLVDTDGEVLSSTYQLPDDRLVLQLLLPVTVEQTPLVAAGTTSVELLPAKRWKPGKVGMIVGASALAVASGVLFGAAMSERGAYLSPDTPDGELAGHLEAANGLGYAAQGTLAAGALCAGVAIAIPW